jgi:hypothetical protein
MPARGSADDPGAMFQEYQPMTNQPLAKRSITFALVLSLIVCVLIALCSIVGSTQSPDGLYKDSQSVLVSAGGDIANLILIIPAMIVSILLARRGSGAGLLLWPGVLFYALYAYLPYLIGARFSALMPAYAAVVCVSALALAGLMGSLDREEIRRRLSTAPARVAGGALVFMALLAFAGLTVNFISTLNAAAPGAALRGHWAADWAFGTPVLLVSGALLFKRSPLGYATGAGALLVSALGGIAFAVAAVLDNMLTSLKTEPAAIAVHLVIAAASGVLLVLFLRRIKPS